MLGEEHPVLLDIIRDLSFTVSPVFMVHWKLSRSRSDFDTICGRDSRTLARDAAGMSDDDSITHDGRARITALPNEPLQGILRIEHLRHGIRLIVIMAINDVSFSLNVAKYWVSPDSLVPDVRTIRCLFGAWPGRGKVI